MSAETPPEIDRAAIAEHAQRTVEQVALRKVRKTLDQMQEDKSNRRRILRKALIGCALLIALGAGFFVVLLFGHDDLPKQAPLKIPSALQQKQ
jgi:hypothetical protein